MLAAGIFWARVALVQRWQNGIMSGWYELHGTLGDMCGVHLANIEFDLRKSCESFKHSRP
jgi:hypothetical protein